MVEWKDGSLFLQKNVHTHRHTLPSLITFCKKLHQVSPKHVRNVLWSETKVEFFGFNSKMYVWHKSNTMHHQKYTIFKVKHGGSIMFWGCLN